MKRTHPRGNWACLAIVGAMLAATSSANAQFGRSSYNPYNPTSSGGSYVPGVTNRYSFPVTPRGPISTLVPVGNGVYYSWPFYPGQGSLMMLTPVANNPNVYAMNPAVWPRGMPYPTTAIYSGSIGTFNNTTASGYRTGGAYTSQSSIRSTAPDRPSAPDNTAGIVLADRPAAPAAQPRNAFNRWANQRDQQGQPDPQRKNEYELERILNQPELRDVISGDGLNVILESLISMPDKLKKTAPIVIEENTLNRLNFTRGTGSVGLLRDEGVINWPQALRSLSAITGTRQDIEGRFAALYKQIVEGGRPDIPALDQLLLRVDQLTDQLGANAKSLTISENVAAKRFIASLEDSIRFLKQPDAAEWLPGKSKWNPATVQDLVQLMSEKRIRFAPALVGNDNVYISTHLMLARLHKQATLNR